MDQLTFEEAYTKLNNIVNGLERSEISLQESLNAFEEGVKLVKYCNELLDKAQNRISLLQMTDNGPEFQPFEDTE